MVAFLLNFRLVVSLRILCVRVCVSAFSVESLSCRLPKDLALASAFSLELCSAVFCFVVFPKDLLFASAVPLQFCFVVFTRILRLLLHFRMNFGYVVCMGILRFSLHIRLNLALSFSQGSCVCFCPFA